jgi:glucosamine--fructose-6-phosphate aminotransferase (isomerizing)
MDGGKSMAQDSYTWQEIISQPGVWRATLERFEAQGATLKAFLAQAGVRQIVVFGCGSTHYLAQAAAAALVHHAGILARPFPSSELLLYPEDVPAGEALLLAVSRSGKTTETLWALDALRQARGGAALAVTCHPDSPLAQQADYVLAAPDAQEQSVAQTRSFVSMFILTQALAATMAGDAEALSDLHRLPGILEKLTSRLGDLPRQLGGEMGIQRFFFLGGGPFYGLACEAMLKMKEMTLSYAEAYHPMEFRHGPMSMVDGHALVVGLLSDTGWSQELRVLQDMQALGARTLAIVEDASALSEWHPDLVVELRSGLGEWSRGALYLPPLQRLAYHRAVAKGLNPDRPTHLTAVVEL